MITPIDNLILMRVSTALGFQHYIAMTQMCGQRDAAVMSNLSGAKHSTNPQHYKGAVA